MPIKKLCTIPNVLSGLRLSSALVMLVLAITGYAGWFIGVLIFAFVLDAIDGPIARWIHQVSELGPKIDSLADFFVYAVFLIGAVLLWPEIVQREMVYIIMVACSLVLPALAGLIKFHKPTSYHTWLVKCAAVAIAPSAIILFLGGPTWPFHIAAVLCVIAAIEEILITLVLDRPASNVRSLIHVMRQQSSRERL